MVKKKKYIYIYICVCVCVYVCMYVCMYVYNGCMYACMLIYTYTCIDRHPWALFVQINSHLYFVKVFEVLGCAFLKFKSLLFLLYMHFNMEIDFVVL